MAVISNSDIISLDKYYVNSCRIFIIFQDEMLKEYKNDENLLSLLSMWYGCLYVVVEAWKEHLKLSDSTVDIMLNHPNVDLLKGCRNDVFHYQKLYVPRRTQSLLSSPDFVTWVYELDKVLREGIKNKLKQYPI